MEQLKVDITKLRTKSAYAAELGVTPAAVDKMVKTGRVKTKKIKGAELIYLGQFFQQKKVKKVNYG